MKRRLCALRRSGQELVIGLHVGSREVLIGVVGSKRRGSEKAPGEPHACDQHAPINFRGEIVGLDAGRLERVA